jgi:hypothetical protein
MAQELIEIYFSTSEQTYNNDRFGGPNHSLTGGTLMKKLMKKAAQAKKGGKSKRSPEQEEARARQLACQLANDCGARDEGGGAFIEVGARGLGSNVGFHVDSDGNLQQVSLKKKGK